MHLATALGLLFAVPAIIALIQEGKDRTVQIFTIIAIVLGSLVALRPHLGPLKDLFIGIWPMIIGIACGLVGAILVVRLKNHVLGTMLVTAGGLLALIGLDWVKASVL